MYSSVTKVKSRSGQVKVIYCQRVGDCSLHWPCSTVSCCCLGYEGCATELWKRQQISSFAMLDAFRPYLIISIAMLLRNSVYMINKLFLVHVELYFHEAFASYSIHKQLNCDPKSIDISWYLNIIIRKEFENQISFIIYVKLASNNK